MSTGSGVSLRAVKWSEFTRQARVKPYIIDDLPSWHPASDDQGGPGQIVIPVPDGDVFRRAETAQGIYASLELISGEQWPAVLLLLEGGDEVVVNEATGETARPGHPAKSTQVVALMQDMTQAFSIGLDARPPAGGRR